MQPRKVSNESLDSHRDARHDLKTSRGKVRQGHKPVREMKEAGDVGGQCCCRDPSPSNVAFCCLEVSSLVLVECQSIINYRDVPVGSTTHGSNGCTPDSGTGRGNRRKACSAWCVQTLPLVALDHEVFVVYIQDAIDACLSLGRAENRWRRGAWRVGHWRKAIST